MDELWSYLWRKKTKVWIWVGLDVVTRLFIAFHVGDRSGESAKALVEAIKARIHGAPGLITTDGLEAYIEKINRPYRDLGRGASLPSGLLSLSQSQVEDRRKV